MYIWVSNSEITFPDPGSAMDEAFLKKLTDITKANLGNPRFGVNELARELRMSHSSLLRKVHALTGKSINQFIREIRLRRAMELMQQDGYTASEVSFKTGFSSPAYFSNCFRDFFGYPPGEVKKIENIRTEGNPGLETAQTDATKNEPVKVEVLPPDRKKNTGRVVFAISSGIILVLIYFISISILNNPQPEKTIAVLPFRNLSNDTTQQYFCDGFKETLLNNLEKINSFSIRSRLSSDLYRDTKLSLPQIGRKLHANYLIEGSIGKSGNDMKIWVQLIKSSTDDHLWSYDTTCSMERFFEIQEEIARSVAENLKAKLLPKEIRKIEKIPTENMEAWNYYLKGGYIGSKGTNYKVSMEYYKKAIELDSGFALAYLGVANCLLFQYTFYQDHREVVLQNAKRTIEKAMEIDPDLPNARIVFGKYYYLGLLDYKKSLEQFEMVLKDEPENAFAITWSANVNRRAGNLGKAITYYLKGMEADPANSWIVENLGETYDYLRDFPHAVEYLNKAIQIQPDDPIAYDVLRQVYLKWKGDVKKAREQVEIANRNSMFFENDQSRFIYRNAIINLFEGNYAEVLHYLSQCRTDFLEFQYNISNPKHLYFATTYGLMNNPELERVYYDSTRVFLEKRIIEMPEDIYVHAALGLAYAGLGLKDQAISTSKNAVKMMPVSKDALHGVSMVENLAQTYVMLGKYREAFEQLKYALSIPGNLTTKLLEIDPRWAPLKNLPGFKKLQEEYSIE